MERIRVTRRPRGRPRGMKFHVAKYEDKKQLADLCRKYTKRAIQTLVDIMVDDGMAEASRITAAKEILDRGYGKAPQSHRLTGADDGPVMMKIDQEALANMPEPTLVALHALVGSIIKEGPEAVTSYQPQVDENEYGSSIH